MQAKLLALLLFSIVTCTTEPVNNGSREKSQQDSVLYVFDALDNDARYDRLNTEQKWEYLINLLAKRYENKGDVDQWATNELNKLWNRDALISPEILRKLLYVLSNYEYTTLAPALANKIFTNQLSEAYLICYPSAASILAYHYNVLQNYDSVSKYIEIIERHVDEDTPDWLRANVFSLKGHFHANKGAYFEAAVQYFRAIDATAVSDKRNRSILFDHLAIMYLAMDQPHKALELKDSSFAVLSGEHPSLESLMTLGVAHHKAENFQRSEEVFFDILNRIGDELRHIKAPVFTNLAGLKASMESFEESLAYLDISDSICRALNLEVGILINAINRSEVYLNHSSLRNALEELDKANSIMNKSPSAQLNLKYYEIAYRIHDALQEKELANDLFRTYTELKDEIETSAAAIAIAEWELSRERERNALEEVSRQRQLKENQVQNLIWIFSVISGILILFLGLVLKNRNVRLQNSKLIFEKQQVDFELQLKAKELLNETLSKVSLQGFKEGLLKQLKAISEEMPEPYSDRLLPVMKSLKSKASKAYYTKLEQRFDSAHQGFSEKLRAIAPELTAIELRVCCLLHLELSSKEIGVLMNRSKGTIDNIRSQTRKKLQLEDNSSLQRFLKRI